MATAPELGEAIRRFPGRRGKPALREAHTLLNDRAESPRESILRVILVRFGLPLPEVNYPITASGRRYRADLAFPDRKVIVEYQGGYHHDPEQWRRDMTRISRLEAAGWFVVQVNANDLDDPKELAERVRRVLAFRPRFA